MVLDPDTFACGYMISGGMAGGAMAWYEVLGAVGVNVLTGLGIGLLLAPIALIPVVGVPILVGLACIGAFMAGWNIGTHLYNAFSGDEFDVREFQYAMIDLSSFCFTIAIGEGIKNKYEAETAEKAGQESGKACDNGKCFVAGTLISTPLGLIPIEEIKAGDKVYSFDEDTKFVSENTVETVFVRETTELVNISIGTETIRSTLDHPFYVPKKGFTNAVELRAGDILLNINGEYVIIEKIQHEILESPIKVYNFRVANYHTYFVGENNVGVHNANYTNSESNVKPEAAVKGSKKHGVNWKEGPARAKATGNPQGQWASEDLNYATEMANSLKSGESGYFDLPEGSKSIVHMPDGTTKPATRFWIRNNGTGTWHGYPME